jgi:hypothetical protein
LARVDPEVNMRDYLARARTALDAFDAATQALAAAAGGAHLPILVKSRDIAAALLVATAALRTSLSLTENTVVDVADLQLRLEDQSRQLARHLKALGEAVAAATGASREAAARLAPALQDLEEQAQRVAAAIFPSAIEGVREINRTLWDMRLIWKNYGEVLDRGVKGKLAGLNSKQLNAVDTTAREVLARFESVNVLMNDLVTAPLVGDGDEAAALVEQARRELMAAVRRARSKANETYKPFHGVLGRAEKLAARIAELFDDLRIPVFPPPDRLLAFADYIDHDAYRALTGVERFALMNIGARLQSIVLGPAEGGGTLADPRFEIRVFDVFPDRIYFTAKAEFVQTVEALADRKRKVRVFETAPAGLHRFRQGSFKQRAGRQGNLQVSYADGTPEDPADGTHVCVDADIDLYRGTVSHLFGEVLVNHLTGSKTDQFKVWDTLVDNKVKPIGGFDVVAV